MKTIKLFLALIVLLAGSAVAQDMGISGGHDLDALWARAQETYDLDREDAVLLLESRTVTVGDEGTVATRVHRVVWIGTSLAIRAYADLRVPWNSATSTLDVEILRTWMDGRWWPDARRIGETAVVHTLPHALDHADDYTAMRETMLLHDGVELPCIMETAYTVAVQGPPAAGADGLFVFPQRDPAVLTEYTVRLPAGVDVALEKLNGAPAPREEANGVRSLTWTVELSPALTLPHTNQPAAHEPTVVWSTWEDWDTLESTWNEGIAAAATVGPDLATALDEHLAGSLEPVRDTVAFWNQAVRPVHYPYRFWRLAPRSADRTWETGYGHALDRSVLLKALLEHLQQRENDPCTKVLCTRTEPGFGETARDLPRLAGYEGLRVEVGRSDLGTWTIDADRGSFLEEAPLDAWARNQLNWSDNLRRTRRLALSLEPGEDGAWQGGGRLEIDNGWGFHGALYGDPTALASRVEGMVTSVLPGAEVTEVGHAVGGISFAVTLSELATNHRDESVLALGPLGDGVLDHLPGDIHLHEAGRTTPLRIPRNMAEEVELRLKVDDRAVRTPAPVDLAGATGSFRVDVQHEHGWLTVTRSLHLAPADVAQTYTYGDPARHLHPAAAWPELRTLLLEAGEPEHGTIVFE